MLLSSPLVQISRRDTIGVLALAVVFPLVMVAVAPAIAFALHRAGLRRAPPIVGAVGGRRSSGCGARPRDRPLKAFAGYDEFTDGVAFYMRKPSARHAHVRHDGSWAASSAQSPATASSCSVRCSRATPLGADWCIAAANAIADRFPAAKRDGDRGGAPLSRRRRQARALSASSPFRRQQVNCCLPTSSRRARRGPDQRCRRFVAA